ncbi:MAG: FAD binding domain-containing protein [Acidobacteria bacterium]|nr:FAD binding domain-containing protein [Acidobacteriota bacterium]
MKAFAYVNPATEKEAVAALKIDGIAMPLGGGQDLLARMKDYIDSPDRIVNVKGLDATVTATPDGGLKIGSAVKIVDLAENAQVAALYPAVVAAAGEVGTPQIRNQGTVAGNINQRPRCWYFRNEEFVCYKKGGSRCFAVNGENQYHAIFGNDGPSHIVHPSSLAVPFVAYGARFRVVGPNGEREVPAAEYFTMPTLQNVLKENVLDDEELLTHVILPAPGNVKHGHYEVRYKQSHDWPLAFATVVLMMSAANGTTGANGTSGNTIRSARVVLGAVAPVPWRSRPAEEALAGKPLSEATAALAGEAAVSEAKPMSGNVYKVQIAKTAVKRAVMRAAGIKTV